MCLNNELGFSGSYVLVSQQNALRGKETSKVFPTECREGVAMPTASEELIALAESAMGAGCWGDGRTGVCAQWSLQSHLHPKSVLRSAHAEICVKGSLCVRACGGDCCCC